MGLGQLLIESVRCDVVPLRKREQPAPRDPEPLPREARSWTEAADFHRAAERLAVERLKAAGIHRPPTDFEIAALVAEASRSMPRPPRTWLEAQERWAETDRDHH